MTRGIMAAGLRQLRQSGSSGKHPSAVDKYRPRARLRITMTGRISSSEAMLRSEPASQGTEASDRASPAQTERARTDLLAMVSHDLRTPLAAIKEAVALLSETAADRLDGRQLHYLTIAREEIDRLNRMIDNLIEISRMDSGKIVLHQETLDLPELLSTATESLSLLISRRNLTVERNIPSRLPTVIGDRDRLLRVLVNLLDNAVKYSPPGGTIRLGVQPAEAGAAALAEKGILASSGHVEVTLANDGDGIPAELLDRIFGKFERVDWRVPGNGLGLAIVRSIVELHNGKVWADSKPGEGTIFHFTLPTKENP